MKPIVIILLVGIILIVGVIIAVLVLSNKPGKAEASEESKPSKKKARKETAFIEDYNVYKLSYKETMTYYILGSIAAFLLGQIFYKSLIMSIIAVGVYLFVMVKWPKIITKGLVEKRKSKLSLQFKDALQAIVSELSAGRSFLNILTDGSIIQNLRILYDENAYIVREFENMARLAANNVAEEEFLRDFARRADIPDITNFVDVFNICRQQGGNLNVVARNTANIIIEKMNLLEEIVTIVSQKKQEQKVMTVMPLVMVLFIANVAPDYMSPMYTTFIGRVVMTAAIGIIVGAYFISKKIMDIEV